MRMLFITLLIYGLLTISVFADQEATEDTSEKAESVSLPNSAQQVAGIKTIILTAVKHQSEIIGYGTVLNLEPLLQLRQQFLAAKAQQQSAQAKYTEAHLNLARTEDLHQQDIVSTRRLQEQQAQWQSDKANLTALTDQQNSIITASRLQWGDILTDWFILYKKNIAEQFLSQRAQLLQLTFPASKHLSGAASLIYVAANGQRHSASHAELISKAPGIDPITQGERFFSKLIIVKCLMVRILPLGYR